MSEPVRLSRERWIALARYMVPTCPEDYETSNRDLLVLSRSVEIDGVIFLPAEYVPYGDELVMDVSPKHFSAMLRA